jgi:bis(5'-nucleosyl)-tetraphosphatase (symmetrical)
MATYAIGDVQGCYDELGNLLDNLRFDQAQDRLWFTGDLVNRGPQSLAVIRLVKSLNDSAITVLGNHDLHLMALAANNKPKPRKRDTLDDVLDAPDRDELIDWLRHRPLIHHDSQLGFTLVHAGLPPVWRLQDAVERAAEVESALQGAALSEFLAAMYGNHPDQWSIDLRGHERLRFIVNCFTRMRYLHPDGRLDLEHKGPPGSQPEPLLPWYAFPQRASRSERVIFGHWSTLRMSVEEMDRYRVYPLDTGCLWGGTLTAMDLRTQRIIQVGSLQTAFSGSDALSKTTKL